MQYKKRKILLFFILMKFLRISILGFVFGLYFLYNLLNLKIV